MEEYAKLADLFESEDGDLFKPRPKKNIPSADDRLIESFNQITDFVKKYDHIPDKESEDIKEALLGARLLSIRSDSKKVDSLINFDELGLLELEKAPESLDELFEVDEDIFKSDIFNTSVLPEKRIVVNEFESARRSKSENFDADYKKLFIDQQKSLANGLTKLSPFYEINQLRPNNFYVYDGIMCYVVEFGEKERKAGGYSQQRILVIFENGTESRMYKRSLAQRLYEGGSVVVNSRYDNAENNEDSVSGYIYVLKSLSQDPKIQTIKDLYKIGVTNVSVSERIRNASSDPTYLMAPVKLVDSYKLTGQYNPQKVEAMIHRVFADAKVAMTIVDNDGLDYIPQEWYSVPINVINEVVDLINNGEIKNYYYDRTRQSLVDSKIESY